MPRYIDAEAFWKEMTTRFDSCADLGEIAEVLDSMPTISTDEVRGVGCTVCQCKEPLPEGGMSHEYYIRGNTMYHYDTHFGWEGTETSYCPECGARLEVSEDA